MNEGWARPPGEERLHYFIPKQTPSLCGKWYAYMGSLHASDDVLPETCCTACHRAVVRRMARLRVEALKSGGTVRL